MSRVRSLGTALMASRRIYGDEGLGWAAILSRVRPMPDDLQRRRALALPSRTAGKLEPPSPIAERPVQRKQHNRARTCIVPARSPVISVEMTFVCFLRAHVTSLRRIFQKAGFPNNAPNPTTKYPGTRFGGDRHRIPDGPSAHRGHAGMGETGVDESGGAGAVLEKRELCC